MQLPDELQGKRVPLDGGRMTPEIEQLFRPFTNGGKLLGVAAGGFLGPALCLEYERNGRVFQTELRWTGDVAEVREEDILRPI